MFMGMIESIQEESVQLLFRAQLQAPPRESSRVREGRALHPDARAASEAALPPATSTTPMPEFGTGGAGQGAAGPGRQSAPARGGGKSRRESPADGGGRRQPVKKDHKVGRNDPCPCGSGKKYKKCCGKDT